jgi:outer membrane protein OmpA-like peptidoglycan-associated protein
VSLDNLRSGKFSTEVTFSEETILRHLQITPALGAVQESGSKLIFPNADTVYNLTATGPGGSASATTSVSVLVHAASNMPDQATRARIQDLLNRIQDAYFDYNKDNLRPDAQTTLVAELTLFPKY